MKIIKVPYNQNVQSTIETIIHLIAVISLVVTYDALVDFQWKQLLISGSILLLAIGYFGLVYSDRIFFQTRDISGKLIHPVDKLGFGITDLHDGRKKFYQWKDIAFARLKGVENLVLFRSRGRRLSISSTYVGYYKLLKAFPKDLFKDAWDEKAVERLFTDLTTCQICGAIAVKTTKCLSCGEPTSSNSSEKHYSEPAAYIREKQLELFSTYDKSEPVELFLPDDTFELDPKWKPLVTAAEVIEFSQKNYW